jgi:hypothetical protein
MPLIGNASWETDLPNSRPAPSFAGLKPTTHTSWIVLNNAVFIKMIKKHINGETEQLITILAAIDPYAWYC